MSDGLKQFIRDSGWSFASLGITALTQFILRIFVARYYGAADLGLYTLTFTAYAFGLVFAGFGIGAGLTKYTAENKDDLTRVKSLTTSGIIISFITGCIMGLIMYIVSPYISIYFFNMPDLTLLFRIVSIVFPFIALEKATLGLLNGVRRMRLYAFVNIMQNTLVIIATIACVLRGYGIEYIVLSMVLPVVLMSFVSMFWVRQYLSKPAIAEYMPDMKILLIFGLYVVLANSLSSIQGYIDSTLLGYFMKDIDVGIYGVAITLITAFRLPPQAIQTITTAMIASYWGRNKIDSIENLVNKCMKYTAFYAVLIAFTAGFLSHGLIRLFFGADYLTAVIPLQILLVGASFAMIQSSIEGTLSSTAYVKVIFRLQGITVLLNIILNLILIPHFGINGAAIASSLTLIVSALIKNYFIQRLVRIKIDWKWFAKLFIITMIIAAATYFIGKKLNIYVTLGLALITLIIVILKYFVNNEDRKRIKEIIHIKKNL